MIICRMVLPHVYTCNYPPRRGLFPLFSRSSFPFDSPSPSRASALWPSRRRSSQIASQTSGYQRCATSGWLLQRFQNVASPRLFQRPCRNVNSTSSSCPAASPSSCRTRSRNARFSAERKGRRSVGRRLARALARGAMWPALRRP